MHESVLEAKEVSGSSLPLFLLSLSSELANDDKPLESRGLAGTLLINSLEQWIKSQIKDLLLATLGSSSLETLGYVCEEISHDDLVQDEVNSVLVAIVYGTVQFETNTQVHLAAMKALLHALDIAQVTLDDETHTTYIMKTAIMSHEAEIRHAACECLVSMVSMYYEVLDLYISEICRGEESVALQAVDFWSSICHVEIEALQELENPHPHSDIITSSGL